MLKMAPHPGHWKARNLHVLEEEGSEKPRKHELECSRRVRKLYESYEGLRRIRVLGTRIRGTCGSLPMSLTASGMDHWGTPGEAGIWTRRGRRVFGGEVLLQGDNIARESLITPRD